MSEIIVMTKSLEENQDIREIKTEEIDPKFESISSILEAPVLECVPELEASVPSVASLKCVADVEIVKIEENNTPDCRQGVEALNEVEKDQLVFGTLKVENTEPDTMVVPECLSGVEIEDSSHEKVIGKCVVEIENSQQEYAMSEECEQIDLVIESELEVDMEHRGEEKEKDNSDDSSSDSSIAGVVADMEDLSDDEEGGKKVKDDKRGPVTPGEVLLQDLPPIEELLITVDENVKMEKVGTVFSILHVLVMVRSLPDLRALDEGTILFLDGKKILGQVFETWGSVLSPFYSIRFNSSSDISERGVETGANVYYAPDMSEFTHYVFLETLKQMRGSDASWEGNNEPPEKFVEYSDDEKEKLAKAKHRGRDNVTIEGEDQDNVTKKRTLTKRRNNNNYVNKNDNHPRNQQESHKQFDQQRNRSEGNNPNMSTNKWTSNPFLKVWPPPDTLRRRDGGVNGSANKGCETPRANQQWNSQRTNSRNQSGNPALAREASNRSSTPSSVATSQRHIPTLTSQCRPPPHLPSPFGTFQQPPPPQVLPFGASHPPPYVSSQPSSFMSSQPLCNTSLPPPFSASLPPPFLSFQPPPFNTSQPPPFSTTQPPPFRLPFQPTPPPHSSAPLNTFHLFGPAHVPQALYTGLPVSSMGYYPMTVPPPQSGMLMFSNQTTGITRPPNMHRFGDPTHFGGGYGC